MAGVSEQDARNMLATMLLWEPQGLTTWERNTFKVWHRIPHSLSVRQALYIQKTYTRIYNNAER